VFLSNIFEKAEILPASITQVITRKFFWFQENFSGIGKTTSLRH
jgi:hypothetical protein